MVVDGCNKASLWGFREAIADAASPVVPRMTAAGLSAGGSRTRVRGIRTRSGFRFVLRKQFARQLHPSLPRETAWCLADTMSQEDSSNPTQIASKAPCPELPRDVLQHVFSYLNDPFDLANCHLVNTRFAERGDVLLCRACGAASTHNAHTHDSDEELQVQRCC